MLAASSYQLSVAGYAREAIGYQLSDAGMAALRAAPGVTCTPGGDWPPMLKARREGYPRSGSTGPSELLIADSR
jgi:hypothetical protein